MHVWQADGLSVPAERGGFGCGLTNRGYTFEEKNRWRIPACQKKNRCVEKRVNMEAEITAYLEEHPRM